MGFIKKTPFKKECVCQIPNVNERDYGLGTIWECDLCKQKWVLMHTSFDGWHWSKYFEAYIDNRSGHLG
jgi:hypothetical protein